MLMYRQPASDKHGSIHMRTFSVSYFKFQIYKICTKSTSLAVVIRCGFRSQSILYNFLFAFRSSSSLLNTIEDKTDKLESH